MAAPDNKVVVIDCSAIMTLVFADEQSGMVESLITEAVSESLTLLVPVLFWYEVCNVLQMAVIRKRLNQDDASAALYHLTSLPLQTDDAPTPVIMMRISRFSAEYCLTAYDSAYLELAERNMADLITCDKALAAAQKRCSGTGSRL